jgi:hypothetical protein
VRTRRSLILVSALVLAGCGGDSGGDGSAPAAEAEAVEEAYTAAHTAAWIKACRAAVADIRKDAPKRAAAVNCDVPVEQFEGNTSFDPEEARLDGRRDGTYEGCAYAWDEAYAAGGGEVEPRC